MAPREKKKLTYQQLESHTVDWAIERMQEVRDMIDAVYIDLSIAEEEKEVIYGGVARQLTKLLELMSPLNHDEEGLLLWANEFVDEYETYDYEA